jgi:hypothetical protein
VRFANLGGRRELFVPLQQTGDVAASDLVLVLDDVSAHDARGSSFATVRHVMALYTKTILGAWLAT